MNDSSHPEKIGPLLDEYLDRLRQGQRPEIEQYAREHPALADEIRQTFSAVLMLQNLETHKSGNLNSSAAVASLESITTGDLPQRIGDFRIVREIGRGGMGVVYEAVQESLSRTVALKILPRQLFQQPKLVERFQREARAAASLHHNNIVPVFSVGQHDEVFHFAMQFIDGIGIDDVISRLRDAPNPDIRHEISLIGSDTVRPDSHDAPCPSHDLLADTGEHNSVNAGGSDSGPNRNPTVAPSTGAESFASSSTSDTANSNHFRKIAQLGLRVADALQHAHDRGILHRDIKPSNLMIDRQGNVWVTDFGLAKVHETNMTHTGDVVGTLQYLPPERLKGTESAVGDVFSLGLTLYELVTLAPAYFGTSQADLIAQIMNGTPRRIREINSRVPRDLETIIHKSISPEPGQRYASARLMAEDLDSFLAGRPIRARPTGPIGRATLWARRNPVPAGLLNLVSLLLIALLAGSIFAAIRFASDNRLITQHLNRSIEAEKEKSNALLESRLTQATALLDGTGFGKSDAVLAALQNAVSLATELGVREKHVGRIQQLVLDLSGSPDLQEESSLQLGDVGEYTARRGAFTKDLNRVAHCTRDGSIRIEGTSNPAQFVILPGEWEQEHASYHPFLLFNHDDSLLAVRGQDIRGQFRIQVWSVADQQLLLDREVDGIHQDTAIAFIENSRVAFGVENQCVAFVNIEDGETVATSEPLREFPAWIVDSGDGNILVGAHDIVQMRQRDASIVTHFSDGGRAQACAMSPLGKYFAAGYSDGKILIWDIADSSKPVVVCQGHSQMITALAMHPHENLVLSSAKDGTSRLWDIEYGRTLLKAPFGGCQFSSDGSKAGYFATGFRCGVWRLKGLDQRVFAYGHYRNGTIRAIDFSPDSQLVGWASEHNGIVLSGLANPRTQRVYDQYLNHGFFAFTNEPENGFVAGGLPTLDLFRFEQAEPETGLPQFSVSPKEELVSGYEWLRSICQLKTDSWVFANGTSRLCCFDSVGQQTFIELPMATNQVAAGARHGIIAFTEAAAPNSIRIWDSGENRLVGQWDSGTLDHATLAFDPLDRWLAVSTGSTTTLLETEKWTCVHTLPVVESTLVGHASFSPNGKLIAITGHGSITLYETAEFNLVGVLHCRNRAELATELAAECCPVCFSRDGRFLAAGTKANNVIVWNLESIRRTMHDLELPAW